MVKDDIRRITITIIVVLLILFLLILGTELIGKPTKRLIDSSKLKTFCEREGFYNGRQINNTISCYSLYGEKTRSYILDYYTFKS